MNTRCASALIARSLATRSLGLALSLSIAMSSAAMAAPGDVNATHNVTNVAGGVYYNTAGSQTVFQATGSGLIVGAGTTVRALEVSNPASPAASLTNNGGSLRFSAPGQVIRIDGTIDASAVKSGSIYLGNGGSIAFDAAFLYQNGKIYANGARGGQISMDVGSLTQTANGRIQAMGASDAGGQITLRAQNVVDLRQGSVIDASGHVIGLVNPALIRIEGALVNVEGVVRANGVQWNNLGSSGGAIRLVANGGAASALDGLTTASGFSSGEKTALQARTTQLATLQSGDIVVGAQATLEANGSSGRATAAGRAGDGGAVTLLAADDILNGGRIRANGGNGSSGAAPAGGGKGGALTLQALGAVTNNGSLQANGGKGGDNTFRGRVGDTRPYQGADGGDSGEILLQYGDIFTQGGSGLIQANGGAGGHSYSHAYAQNTNNKPHDELVIATLYAYGADGSQGGRGGRVIFDGPVNPVGGGTISANGGAGGKAGNAEAHVFAHASSVNGVAIAKAQVFTGEGGAGGAAGGVFVPQPGSLTMPYSARNGQNGADGKGEIHAHAVGRTAITEGIIRERRLTETKAGSSKLALGYWKADPQPPRVNAPPADADDLPLPAPPTFENGGGSGSTGGSGSGGGSGSTGGSGSGGGSGSTGGSGSGGGSGSTGGSGSGGGSGSTGGSGSGGGSGSTGGSGSGGGSGSTGGSGSGGGSGSTGDGSDTELDFRNEAAFLLGRERRMTIQLPRGFGKSSAPLIVFGQPTMFLAKTYESLTEVILRSADAQYEILRANGENDSSARQAVRQTLVDQGIDAAMASELVKTIEGGALKASESILAILKTMSQAS
ncbi:MAG: hypothetical protein IPK79_04245 [Vampirovibrionales bacterium]|nr:hypothetical protein [Vampirovibrionales bacterium]